GIDGEVMVVGGDLDLARAQLLYRMIAAVVAELQLVGFAAERESNQLMSQADAEYRRFPEQAANVFDGVRAWLGITGAVGQKNAVWLKCEHIFCRRLRRHHRHVAALAGEHPQDVVLDAVVVSNYMKLRRLTCSAGLWPV